MTVYVVRNWDDLNDVCAIFDTEDKAKVYVATAMPKCVYDTLHIEKWEVK